MTTTNQTSDRVLGKYEVLAHLGTTGLAAVYRARDASGNIVALKVLHAYFSKEVQLVQRFVQAIEQVKRLQHPNIVAVHGVESEGETTALVMEYVPWPTLRARRERLLPFGETLTILRQVAAALDYAHQQGVVHRDLRPSNVFYDQETGQARVSDFGTISLVEGGHALMRTSVNTPNPGYAAPEQAQYQRPTPQNDVYSLGALAYELLTGERPFDALSPHTVLSRQLNSSPIAPSVVVERVPPAVDNVILKALGRDPQERFATCTALVEALEEAVGPLPVHVPGATMLPAMPVAEPRLGEAVGAQESEEARVVCPICGTGNAASSARCSSCWGSLEGQQLLTSDEEHRWVQRYLAALRKRKRIVWGTVGTATAALLALWVFNVVEARPPLPPASTAITSESGPGEWSMAQRDARHTGAAPGPAFAPEGEILWRFESAGPILAAPAVTSDRVYVSTSAREIVALDRASGDVVWTHSVVGPMDSSPAVAGNLVYVGLRGGSILALDAATGDQQWRFETGQAIMGSFTVVDGALYVGSTDHRIYSLDAQTGELRWTRDTTNGVITSPAFDQGIVVVGAKDDELYMIDASNGTLRYQVNVGTTVDTSPTLVGDIAYVVTRAGNVMAFDYKQKDIPFQKAAWGIWFQFWVWNMAPTPAPPPGLIWGVRIRESVRGDLATDGERLFVATTAGVLRAFDLDTGEVIWKVEGLDKIRSSPIVSGDTVVQVAEDGTVIGVDAATGERLWSTTVGEGVLASAVLAGGTLYVPTAEGTLLALR